MKTKDVSKNNIDIDKQVELFKDAMLSGIEKIRDACVVYVEAIKSTPDARKLFREACPHIPPSAWANFEMVGHDAMDYRLLWGGGAAQTSLKRLPRSEQEELLDNGVLVPCGDSERVVPVENLSKSDIGIVFYGRKVRTVDEQRALLARKKSQI